MRSQKLRVCFPRVPLLQLFYSQRYVDPPQWVGLAVQLTLLVPPLLVLQRERPREMFSSASTLAIPY